MGQYFETAYVPRQADLIIFNHGHNTDNNVPASTHMGMDLAILYTMLQRHPNAGAIIVSQNPLRDSDNGTVGATVRVRLQSRQASVWLTYSSCSRTRANHQPGIWTIFIRMLPVTRKFSTWLKICSSGQPVLPGSFPDWQQEPAYS